MRIRLEKQNRVHLHFVILTLEGSMFKEEDGKNEVLSVQSMTHLCKTEEQAVGLFLDRKKLLIKKGFSVVDEIETEEIKSGNFDKAEWHYGGDFPEELDQFRGYVHTGIFIAWLINNDFILSNSKSIKTGILNVQSRKITGPEFYRDFLDGVFVSDFLNPIGASFTLAYYEKGEFNKDYEETLCDELDSIYHVNDSWKNYDIIQPVFNRRFIEFSNNKTSQTDIKLNWLQQQLQKIRPRS